MFYEVIPEGPINALTYSSPLSLEPGQIVLVPLGKKTIPGIVLKKVVQPNFKTKSISKVLYSDPLPPHLLKIIKFISDYYQVPMGVVVSLMLPNGVEKNRRKTEHLFGQIQNPEQSLLKPQIELNTAQKNALRSVQEAVCATKLLYGVTGSGKTNIYLKMALETQKSHKSTILLVPEIALTSQLVQVFRTVFSDQVIVLHSKQTESTRHQIWEHLLLSNCEVEAESVFQAHPQNGEDAASNPATAGAASVPEKHLSASTPHIVIGPRSALFAPLSNLGLIIIDEEHESTYYQENAPKYSAIRVASFMATSLKIPLLLGSATPTVEDFYLAKKKNSLIELTEKAKTTAIKPQIKIIDLKDRTNFSKNKYFSNQLLTALKDNLEKKRQTLIFHNRRGSSPLTICENCGEEILCPHCFLPLTLHADSYNLICHTCGFTEKVPLKCPKCGSPSLIHKGYGTKLIESELKKLFPKAKIRRFDADNKTGESLEDVYDEVKNGETDILIGTQTLAKGLDLPKLATVGIVQADAGLSLPDFAAEEHTFQLLAQVIGRVGRGHLETAEVFIQTFRPNHPVLQFATSEDYLKFYDYEIHRRAKSGFPPYKFIAKLEITMKTEKTVLQKIRTAQASLAQNPKILVSSPIPAFHERTDKGYTWQIILRSNSRQSLLEACQNLDKNFKITLDPPRLL